MELVLSTSPSSFQSLPWPLWGSCARGSGWWSAQNLKMKQQELQFFKGSIEEESRCERSCRRCVLGVYKVIEKWVIPSGGRRSVLGQEYIRR